jgi:hypothetical protein
MSEDTQQRIPEPTATSIAQWLKQVDRSALHQHGWIVVNRRYHEMARAIRPFMREHFTEEEREAAFDAFTLALMTVAHFNDIAELTAKFAYHTPEKQDNSLRPYGGD